LAEARVALAFKKKKKRKKKKMKKKTMPTPNGMGISGWAKQLPAHAGRCLICGD
jgi:hypothetical protein